MPNLRLAFRTLFKSPFITLVAILSLALGIGANSAIFSLFDQMLLRPLPVPNPEELVNFASPGPKPGSQFVQPGRAAATRSSATRCSATSSGCRPASPGIAAHRNFGASLGYQGTSLERRRPAGVGQLLSRCSGLTPALGRLFTPDDDKTHRRPFRGRCSATTTGAPASS